MEQIIKTKITNRILYFSIAFSILSFWGCMHTYMGGQTYSPDNKYVIDVVCHGQSAQAYVDNTVKKVFINIYDKSRSDNSFLFSKCVILTARDLDWLFSWPDSKTIRIDFFEGKYSAKGVTFCGFVLIMKDDATKEFKITDHSANIQIESKVYFF